METAGFNHSTYHYTNRRVTWLVYLMLTFAVAAFSAYNYLSYTNTAVAIDESLLKMSAIRSEVAGMRREKSRMISLSDRTRETESELLFWQAKEINEILKRKNFSWSELFYSLEKAAPAGISVSRIKPSYRNNKIRISGFSKNLENTTLLVDNLREAPFINRAFLLGQDAVMIENKYPAISFEIEANGEF